MTDAAPPATPPAVPSTPPTPRPRNTAGAWAAAALVLALGSLMFVVIAHIRITDLEGRIADLEAAGPPGSSVPVTAATPSTGRPAPEQQVAPTSAPAEAVTAAPAAPADPEAARLDIVATFRAVYDGGATDERVRHVDDPTGVAVAIESVRNGPNTAAVTAAKVNVQQIRFLSESRAQVVYGVDVNGQNAISARQGEARIVDGEWKVTRATVCQDLQSVGATC